MNPPSWCYLCRTLNRQSLILHQSGCPDALLQWEAEEMGFEE
jgi:hypothetical protein